MFSQVSVILSTVGFWQTPPGQTLTPPQSDTTSWADTPQADIPLDRHAPAQADGYCSGRYASYWNAFLFSQ